MPGLWPWLLFECFRRFLLCQNITWISTVTLITVVLMHCFNTWLFSIRLGWGISGAALAVSIAYWLLLLMAMMLFMGRAKYLSCVSVAAPGSAYQLTRSTTPPPAQGSPSSSSPPRSVSPMPLHTSTSTGSLQDLSSPQDTQFMLATLPTAQSAADTWPPLSKDIFRGWNDFLRLGLPASSSMFLEWGAYEIYSAIAARLPGTVSLATHAVLCNTAGLWYMAPLGLATACSTLVGNALGAGNPERARRFASLGVAVVMLYGAINGALSFTYRHVWGSVWSPDEAVQDMVSAMMPYMALYSFVDVIKCVGTAILRGTGRPSLTLIGNAISSLLVGYPSAFLLVFSLHLALPGLWTAMSLGWLTASSIYCTVLLRTDWQAEARAAAERNESALGTLSSVVSVSDI